MKIKLGSTVLIQTNQGFQVDWCLGYPVSGPILPTPEQAIKECINRIKPYDKPRLP